MVKNHNLAKSIHDCGWYELTRQLTYKSEWNNRIYHKVDRFHPSSQLCNVCGYKNEDTKNLNIRFGNVYNVIRNMIEMKMLV